MIQSQWPTTVNNRFFAYNEKPKDNVVLSEYISGRVVGYQRNTKKLKTIKCSIKLRIKDELPLFWTWFNDTLGQTAGAFSCAALGNGLYRFTAIPEPANTDLKYRVLTLELEEV